MVVLYSIELVILALCTFALFQQSKYVGLTRVETKIFYVVLVVLAFLWFFALYLVLKQSF